MTGNKFIILGQREINVMSQFQILSWVTYVIHSNWGDSSRQAGGRQQGHKVPGNGKHANLFPAATETDHKLVGHQTQNWYRRLEDGFLLSWRTTDKQSFLCQRLSVAPRGRMWSHSEAFSSMY